MERFFRKEIFFSFFVKQMSTDVTFFVTFLWLKPFVKMILRTHKYVSVHSPSIDCKFNLSKRRFKKKCKISIFLRPPNSGRLPTQHFSEIRVKFKMSKNLLESVGGQKSPFPSLGDIRKESRKGIRHTDIMIPFAEMSHFLMARFGQKSQFLAFFGFIFLADLSRDRC